MKRVHRLGERSFPENKGVRLGYMKKLRLPGRGGSIDAKKEITLAGGTSIKNICRRLEDSAITPFIYFSLTLQLDSFLVAGQGYAPRNAVDFQKALHLPFKDLPVAKELAKDGKPHLHRRL